MESNNKLEELRIKLAEEFLGAGMVLDEAKTAATRAQRMVDEAADAFDRLAKAIRELNTHLLEVRDSKKIDGEN